MNFSISRFFREGIKWKVVFLISVIFTVFFVTFFPLYLQKILYDISFTLIFLLGYLNSERKHPAFIPLALSAVILIWISAYFKLLTLFYFSSSLNIFFFAIVVKSLITNLANSKTITPLIILDSIIAYLLIGLIFSMIIALLDRHDPTAFNFPAADGKSVILHLDDFIYFTFVTLSTTGYGDITPLKPYARSLCILIAITGQMYIGIIIAMLVGKYAASRRDERNEE
ncbi:MAG: potassium channel family protein [Bacteroidales bacterium]